MDVGQLQLQVDGVTRSFAEWSAYYADTYYPKLAEQCYRVPAQHFNQQNLVADEMFKGMKLGVPNQSKSFGELAHTLVLEYFEEVGHRLQARGSGPLFIISSVNYDNYLARLKTPMAANKRKKKGTRGGDSRKEETLKDDAKGPTYAGVKTGREVGGGTSWPAHQVTTCPVEHSCGANSDTCSTQAHSKMAAVEVGQSCQRPAPLLGGAEAAQPVQHILSEGDAAQAKDSGAASARNTCSAVHVSCPENLVIAVGEEAGPRCCTQACLVRCSTADGKNNKNNSNRLKWGHRKKSIVQRPEHHVTFTSADKGERGGPRARENKGQAVNGDHDSAFAHITTTVTREQGNEKSDDRWWRDSSREDEGNVGEKVTTRADDVRGRGGKRGEAAANRVIPPRPKEMGQRPQRGDIDIVIISQKYGVVLVEVKAAGVSGSSWAHNEAASRDAYRSVLLKATKQLNRASHVFRFITPDLIPPPDITLVIAVPFMSRRQLHQILLEGKGEFCDSFHYLCKGDLKNRKWVTGLFTKHEACRQQRETVGHDWCSSDAGAGTEGLGCSLCRWWDENITECTCLPLHHVKSIVGRICGLMSIVSVWTQTTPRVEVRTTGQAVSEVGRRVADIVLLPEQAALLADTSCNRVCLTGPMGSGKTLLLQLKGRQWLAEGRRVVILNVRTSGRGRAVGYALEEAIVRQDGESASSGTVERHDLAIAETSLEQLAARLQVSGSVEDICFILDELTKQTFDFVLQLTRRYPDCPVWCVAMFLHSPLQGFRHFRLGDVLRSPPSVQLLLRQLDLNPYHRHAYTTRSAARGLPCDGPPIILIQHRLHDPSTRPLYCHQCAIELADILQHSLGLAVGANDSHVPMTTMTRKSKPSAVEATPLSFRDVLLLVGMPVDAYRPVSGGLFQAGKEDVKKFCRHVLSSPILAELRERGLPVKPVADNTSREIAIPSSDEIILTDVMGTHGLERKVVFFLPGGRLYEDMERITDTQIQADGQCVLDDMFGGMMVAASPDPASPYHVSSDSWPHRGGNTSSNAAAVQVRLGMEVRGDSPALTSLDAQDQTRADAAILVPDVTDEVSRRTEEVERLREALDCLSMDDQDWLFIAAARCVAQFIFVVPCPESKNLMARLF